MKTRGRAIRFGLAAIVVLMVASAAAHETGGWGSRNEGFDDVVRRIAGGAGLLHDLERSRATSAFRDRAHHLDEMLGDRRVRPEHVERDWRLLHEAFVDARRSASDDRRVDFLVMHLAEDVAAGDRLVGRTGGGFFPPPGSQGPGQHSFLRGETCVGVNAAQPRPCAKPDESRTFPVPPDVSVIRRIKGEWRDYGRGVKAQVLVDGRLVWQTDVSKDWDTDARDVEVRVRPGSKLTVRSSNGDPLWLRRLEIEYEGSSRGRR
ncbi:MAG: hypothetical protein ACREQY_12960 [Candidatus Binatia bacterium]